MAPHPDDEVLGCGGLISKLQSQGCKIYVLYFSLGALREFSPLSSVGLATRLAELEKCAKFLKYSDYHLAFPPQKSLYLDPVGMREVIHAISDNESGVSLAKLKPGLVLLPSPHASHQDHRLVAQAAISALKPQKGPVPIVLVYEESTDQWTEGNPIKPDFFITLTEAQLRAKVTALGIYKSQLQTKGQGRNTQTVTALARLRGSLIGTNLAEAYQTLRVII